jgi:hypothetical protein
MQSTPSARAYWDYVAETYDQNFGSTLIGQSRRNISFTLQCGNNPRPLEGMLTCRFDLPEPINVDKVTANLDKGVFHVTAMKSKPGGVHGQQYRAA